MRTPMNPIAGLLLALLVVLGPGYSAAESVTVVSWGGSYTDACEEAYLKPFAADTGSAGAAPIFAATGSSVLFGSTV